MSAKDYLMTLVQENEFLKALPPSDAELLSQAAEYVNFPPGHVLFNKGDVADAMFFIVEGSIEIIDSEFGSTSVLATLHKSEQFGEQGLLEVNEGLRTAGARSSNEVKLIKISGELIRSLLRHQAQLVEKLEKIGSEQQDINRVERILQLMLRLQRSRSSLSMKTPRSESYFSTMIVEVDTDHRLVKIDEVIAPFRNPVRANDQLTLSGSLSGTPITFDTRVLAVTKVDGSDLYECEVPETLTYQQQRSQFRLELGVASRSEAIVTKGDKKFRGKIVDVSEGGVSVRLRRGVPIEIGDTIDKCALMLDSESVIHPKIQVMNIKDVVQAPNLLQFGARFVGLASHELALLKDFMRETERRKLRNSRM